MKRQLLAALVVLAVATGMTSSVAAEPEASFKEADVNVTIASQTAIDVHPQQLTYETLNPGQTGTSTEESRSFGSVELENVGSTDINDVWVNATQTNAQYAQFGSSTPGDFNAGNFLMLKPDPDDSGTNGPLQGDTDTYLFVNRKEFGVYNNSLAPEYVDIGRDGSGGHNEAFCQDESCSSQTTPSDVGVGRFRMGDDEYFFALPVGGNGQCDGTGNTFDVLLVAKQPHNSTETVPVDFTAPGTDDPDGGDTGYNTIGGRDYNIYNITNTGSNQFGVTAAGTDDGPNGVSLDDPDNSDEVRNYDVVTQCDQDDDATHQDTDYAEAVRTHYNIEAGGYSDLKNAALGAGAPETQYLMEGATLSPSQAVKLNVQVMVPRGVPQGVVTEGQLSVVVDTN